VKEDGDECVDSATGKTAVEMRCFSIRDHIVLCCNVISFTNFFKQGYVLSTGSVSV